MRIILASASPRRRELLRAAGIDVEVIPSEMPESLEEGEPPARAALRLAEDKARAVLRRTRGPRLLIGADTVVVVGGRALGKPRDPGEARDMLAHLSGASHEVQTGVVLLDGTTQGMARGLATTRVSFAALTTREIDWYVASGEGADKAGGYAIQGRASLFVREIQGSHPNVVGLPIDLVYRLARELGADLLEGRRGRGRLDTPDSGPGR